jgi:regulator of protease activity HflC (stomatin/prohibitin superfamily)
MASFLDVITANEERLTRINLAEAYEASLLPKTRGSALERIAEAEGEAAQIDATSTGYREWFMSISQNGRRSPRLTAVRIAAETMEAQLSKTRLIAAPANVRVWLGSKGHWPRDPNAPEGE